MQAFRYQFYLDIPGCIDTIEITSKIYDSATGGLDPETFQPNRHC